MLSGNLTNEEYQKATLPEKSQISNDLDSLLSECITLKKPLKLRRVKSILSESSFNNISAKIKSDEDLNRLLKVTLIKKCISITPDVENFDEVIKKLNKWSEAIPILFSDPNNSIKEEAVKYLRELFINGIKDPNNLHTEANKLLKKKKLPLISGLHCLIGDPDKFLQSINSQIHKKIKKIKFQLERDHFIEEILSAARDTRIGTFEKSLGDLSLDRAFPRLTITNYYLLKQKIERLFGSWANAIEAAEKHHKKTQNPS